VAGAHRDADETKAQLEGYDREPSCRRRRCHVTPPADAGAKLQDLYDAEVDFAGDD
jgi:hypothetical protein